MLTLTVTTAVFRDVTSYNLIDIDVSEQSTPPVSTVEVNLKIHLLIYIFFQPRHIH
jgi:hypothetical protein